MVTPFTSMDATAASLELAGAASSDVQIDGLDFGKQTDNVAMGRFPDGAGSANNKASFQLLVCPTAGKANKLCENKNYMPTVRVPVAPAP